MNSIEAENLTRKFGNFTAVDHISFSVGEGEIFGFLGANGAGKTTAMKMLSGLLQPSSGKAQVAGWDVYRQKEKIKASIGYMSQRFSLYDDLTPFENIRFYGGVYGLSLKTIRDKAHVLIKKLGLENARDKLVKELPLGWKQKLAFSVATLHDPRIIFLDEPTSGVDPITRRQFWDMIYEAANNSITIFITTHYMDEAEYCDRISMMVAGKIEALDSPAGLKKQYEAKDMNQVFVKIARQS